MNLINEVKGHLFLFDHVILLVGIKQRDPSGEISAASQ